MTSSISTDVELIEVKKGVRFSVGQLRRLLPDVETALFFAKVYKLDAYQLGQLLHRVVGTPLADALFGQADAHSTTLQAYLIGGYEHDDYCLADEGDDCTCTPVYYEGVVDQARKGEVKFDTNAAPPQGEILPQVWESLEVEVAESISKVIDKLDHVLDRLPGKEGQMIFQTMAKMNHHRPTIGRYEAGVHHDLVTENLVILDVSGSMTEATIRTIIDDVVSLSYKANAHLAIVSDTATHWEPGTYDSDVVLNTAEFGGTHYETLVPLLDQDWGTVITIADYDSSASARDMIQRKCTGHIGQVLDISLVNQPTWLSVCVGSLADEVKPLMIASSYYVMQA